MTFWPCLRIFWQLSRTILDGVHCFTVHCKFSEDLPWHCHSRSLSCYWGYNFGSPDFFQVNVTCPCQSSLALLSISTYVCRYLWFLQVYVTGFYSSFPSCFSCRRVGYKLSFSYWCQLMFWTKLCYFLHLLNGNKSAKAPTKSMLSIFVHGLHSILCLCVWFDWFLNPAHHSKNTNSESKQPRLILFWYKESIS